MEMPGAPTARVRELETLLARIRHASTAQLNYDMWERWGSVHASPAERAAMEAELEESMRERAAAKLELEALVAATRADAPDEIGAWAGAHDAYLAAFLDDCAERSESDGIGASVAIRERAAWAEVRAGTRTFVDENPFYVTLNVDRYRRLFGIDP
jgi:hypothetical protein